MPRRRGARRRIQGGRCSQGGRRSQASRRSQGCCSRRRPPARARRGPRPKTWCSSCYPETRAPPWPAEGSGAHAPSAEGARLVARRVARLSPTRSRQFRRRRCASRADAGRPPQPRRRSARPALVDFLGSGFEARGWEVGSCFASEKDNLRSRMHTCGCSSARCGACCRRRRLTSSSAPTIARPRSTAARACAPRSRASRARSTARSLVDWITRSNGAADLAEWDEQMAAVGDAVGRPREEGRLRGHLRTYSYCGGWPSAAARYRWSRRPTGARRARGALGGARGAPVPLRRQLQQHKAMAEAWGLSADEAAARDEPNSLSMEEQVRRFRYVVHAEGACSSADRLKQSLGAPALLLKQASPCTEWFEEMFSPWEHYVLVDGSFANVSEAVGAHARRRRAAHRRRGCARARDLRRDLRLRRRARQGYDVRGRRVRARRRRLHARVFVRLLRRVDVVRAAQPESGGGGGRLCRGTDTVDARAGRGCFTARWRELEEVVVGRRRRRGEPLHARADLHQRDRRVRGVPAAAVAVRVQSAGSFE